MCDLCPSYTPFLVLCLTINYFQSFTHALYHLAANPELLAPLRAEVEAILGSEGWTKAAMGKMHKLDSFMRESQRFNGINASTSLLRVIFSFSPSVLTY